MIRLLTCLLACLPLLLGESRAESSLSAEEALQHIRWQDAQQAIGQEVLVSGQIVNINTSGRVTFLNFDTKRPADFVAVIFRESLAKFPEDLKAAYEGRLVEIRGMVTTFKDRPQIVVGRPEQIRLLETLPETAALEKQPEITWSGSPDEIMIATLNTLNIFDDVDDPYHADEITPAKPREELEHLADTIRKVNADVLALQEVESRGYLERFVKVLLPEMGYKYIVQFEGNDLRGIDNCLLSRAPIGEVTSRRHLRFVGPDGVERQFNRDVPAITVLPPGAEPIEFWVVHLKSKGDSAETSEPIRLAEASELRRLLDDRLGANPEARVVVLGDFNDTRQSKSMTTIFGTGATALWSPEAQETPDSLPVEHPEWEPIDFLVCSPAMARLYIQDTCQVRKAPATVDGTDHDPVFARFRLK